MSCCCYGTWVSEDLDLPHCHRKEPREAQGSLARCAWPRIVLNRGDRVRCNNNRRTKQMKKTKTAPIVVKSKKRSYAKPRMIESSLPSDSSVAASFAITIQTPSLRWRSKPSINCCFHETYDGGPSCPINMFDTTAMDAISAHRYDMLKASLHSTRFPVIVPIVKEAHKTKQRIMPTSKSFAYNFPREMPVLTTNIHKGSMQNIPTHAKCRYWVPTPTEMVKIGDKIPKAFVKTSLTGRKTVEVPTDTRTWFRGNLTPIESSASVTHNQSKLVRGARLLNRKMKKDKEQKCPPLEPSGKKPGKPPKNDLPLKPLMFSKTKKIKELSSRVGREPSKCSHHRVHRKRPFKLSTVYMNTKSRLNLLKVESASTDSLPPPYTPSDDAQANRDIIAEAASSVGLNAYVECFHCRVRYQMDELTMHQAECCQRPSSSRSLLSRSCVGISSEQFENSLHKLDFNRSSSSLLSCCTRPSFIEVGGQLSALPAVVVSNNSFNKTCWFCGWEYCPDITDRHCSECAAVRGTIRPTAEGRRLRRMVERKMKTYGKLNPRKKNLW